MQDVMCSDLAECCDGSHRKKKKKPQINPDPETIKPVAIEFWPIMSYSTPYMDYTTQLLFD
jgi:hypothetical protein